jgi:hypothetical protein
MDTARKQDVREMRSSQVGVLYWAAQRGGQEVAVARCQRKTHEAVFRSDFRAVSVL